MISDDDIAKAIDRIAQSPDGAALYLWAQKKLCGIPSDGAIGALQEHHGARKVAAELMALMSRGIADSDRDSGSGRPIVFVVSGGKPVSSGRRALHRGVGDAEPGSGGSSSNAA